MKGTQEVFPKLLPGMQGFCLNLFCKLYTSWITALSNCQDLVIYSLRVRDRVFCNDLLCGIMYICSLFNKPFSHIADKQASSLLWLTPWACEANTTDAKVACVSCQGLSQHQCGLGLHKKLTVAPPHASLG